MTPDVWTSAVYFTGGVLGSAIRAWLTTSQVTFSRKSFADVVVGGLVGIMYPLYPLIPLVGSLLQQGTEIALLSYFAGDMLQNLLTNRIPGIQSVLTGGKTASSVTESVLLSKTVEVVPITPAAPKNEG